MMDLQNRTHHQDNGSAGKCNQGMDINDATVDSLAVSARPCCRRGPWTRKFIRYAVRSTFFCFQYRPVEAEGLCSAC
jgi:hypothetical protein